MCLRPSELQQRRKTKQKKIREMTVSLVSMAKKHMQKKVDPYLIILKCQLKIDQRPKCKT